MTDDRTSMIRLPAGDNIDLGLKLFQVSASGFLNMLDWVGDLTTAKSPADFAAKWLAHAGRQVEIVEAQYRAFDEVAQKLIPGPTCLPGAKWMLPELGLADAAPRTTSAHDQHGSPQADAALSPEDEVLLLHVME